MTLEIQFNEWLDKLNKTEQADNSIIAFNFGLFETHEGFTMYLIGSETFDPDDDDWAVNVDFEPKDKYLTFEKSLIKTKEWKEIQKISTKLITDYVNSEKFKESILKNATAITTGFDDGDLTRIK